MNLQPELRTIYDETNYLSIKYDSYFPVYEELLQKYAGSKVTLVEVGVFNGGSLFMWRKYLGPDARIIGIDLNPIAKKWEESGFEIHIGDQSSEPFWEDFFKKVGAVDIFIDDGGHTNQQQIITAHHAIRNIKDGGILIVEDVHTSYFREFGNPFRYSFLNFARKMIDSINSRASALKLLRNTYSASVHSVSFYESIVAFRINRSLCKVANPTSNGGVSQSAGDFRYHGTFQNVLFTTKQRLASPKEGCVGIFAKILIRLLNWTQFCISRLSYFTYRKFFN